MVRYVTTFVNSQRPQILMPLLREPRNLNGMVVSLEEKRKYSPAMPKILVAANFSDSDDERIDQRTRS
jgi:hypothetical protein